MNYDRWLQSVPSEIRGDSLWRMEAYRLALFASEVGWADVTKLMKDSRTVGLGSQLFRALGSIHANFAEGYSRGSGRDRARFYEYALGSARESRSWYFDARHVLGQAVSSHRMRLLTEIIRLALAMIPDQRGDTIREEHARYDTDPKSEVVPELLTNVPPP